MTAQRPLGLYERYSLARAQAGVAPVVAITATLPTSPSVAPPAVRNAIDTLLRRYPLLRCEICDRTTNTPRFRLRDETTGAEIVQEAAEVAAEGALETALRFTEAAQGGFDLDNGPLWRVWVGGAGEGRTRVTLLVHHTIADGTGAKMIFAELLSLLRSPVVGDEPKQDQLAASLEETLDTALGVWGFAKVLLSHVLLPALPSFLRPSIGPPVYLGNALSPPHLQPSSFKYLSLPPSVVAGLKTAGKSHGVNTLHPILHQAAFAAFAATAPSDGAASPPSFTITGSTPYSLRDLSLHPPATGNYVASHDSSLTVSSLLPLRFWAHCAAYGKELVDPATKLAATKRMGMLALLPDGEISATQGKPARTKWEEWVEERGRKGEFDQTFEVSNLGVLPVTGWEEEGLGEVSWVQPGSVLNAAIQINTIAVRGGNLTCTASYRQSAVDEDSVVRFWRAYEKILIKLSEGEVGEEATFSEMAKLVE